MTNDNKSENLGTRSRRRFRQAGIAMPLVTIALLAMLAIAGLAIDSSHALSLIHI